MRGVVPYYHLWVGSCVALQHGVAHVACGEPL